MIKNKAARCWQGEYCNTLQGWQEKINELQLHFANVIEENWHKTKYITRNLPFAPKKMIMCPPHSILNFAPNQQHRIDYGTGVIEGLSAEPTLNKNNEIIGVNVILLQQRLARFARSLKARHYALPIPIETFGQVILDTVAVHGTKTFLTDDGFPTRAYIRPSAGSGVGPWGVCNTSDHFIDCSVLVFRWGNYFSEPERIDKFGVNAVITGAQRMSPIEGKHASNYGSASAQARLARNLNCNYDELIYLAPYGINKGVVDFNFRNFNELMQHGVLSDGPAEEIFAILKDGETLIYPPLRVNRLGGTVLDYLAKHLAPSLGLIVREQDITLEQLRRGDIIGIAFVGNAAKITAIGKIDIVRFKFDSQEEEKVETLFDSNIHPIISKICNQFSDELRGIKLPSHKSLLTPVDLDWGKECRAYLDDFWTKKGFKNLKC